MAAPQVEYWRQDTFKEWEKREREHIEWKVTVVHVMAIMWPCPLLFHSLQSPTWWRGSRKTFQETLWPSPGMICQSTPPQGPHTFTLFLTIEHMPGEKRVGFNKHLEWPVNTWNGQWTPEVASEQVEQSLNMWHCQWTHGVASEQLEWPVSTWSGQWAPVADSLWGSTLTISFTDDPAGLLSQGKFQHSEARWLRTRALSSYLLTLLSKGREMHK